MMMAQQRWITGHVDPAAVCGAVYAPGRPRLVGGDSVPSTSWEFCVAPAGTAHSTHPLANCFRRATPCQVLLFAPFRRGGKDCLAHTLEYWLEAVPKMLAYYAGLLEEVLEVEPARPSKGTLDFWGVTA